VDKTKHGQIAARFVVVPSELLLNHIPRRLGEHQALDDAVKVVCNATAPEETTRAYGVALQSLQRSIGRGITSETMAAAMLLQMHDFSRKHPQWAVHAKGVVKMLEVRGPDAIRNDLDKSLLQAQIGHIAFDALRQRKLCFLEEPKWNALIKSLRGQDADDASAWQNTMLVSGVRFPGLIVRYETLLKSDLCVVDKTWPQQVQELITDLMLLRTDLWRCDMACLPLSCSLPPTIQDGERERQQPSNRIQPAMMFSTKIYLIIIHCMVGRLRASLRPIEDWWVPEDDYERNLPVARQLVDTAKQLYERLREMDSDAARRTAEISLTMFVRVYGVEQGTQLQKDPFDHIYAEVFQMLSQAQCQNEMAVRISTQSSL